MKTLMMFAFAFVLSFITINNTVIAQETQPVKITVNAGGDDFVVTDVKAKVDEEAAPDDPDSHRTLKMVLLLPDGGSGNANTNTTVNDSNNEDDNSSGPFDQPVRGAINTYAAFTLGTTLGDGPGFQLLEGRLAYDWHLAGRFALRIEGGVGSATTQETIAPDQTGVTAGVSALAGVNYSPDDFVFVVFGIRDYLLYLPGEEDVINTMGPELSVSFGSRPGLFGGLAVHYAPSISFEAPGDPLEAAAEEGILLPVGAESPVDPGTKVAHSQLIGLSLSLGYSW